MQPHVATAPWTRCDPEFFGSALALANPVPLPGNKIALVENGDEYFPAMLSAICSAGKTIRGV